jgi:hypothetical protein
MTATTRRAVDDFDPEAELLHAMDARIRRLEATREVASALGVELDRVAADIDACKELRRTCIQNWKNPPATPQSLR